jgi:hypothetical protein
MGIFRKATLTRIVGATVLAATAITSATPAMADPYNRGRRGGGDATGAAIVGGIIGIALGAIIVSSANNRNNRYADRGWTWREGYYWDRQGRRFDRDGRPCDEQEGYYNRRGYQDRGWQDRGWQNQSWGRDNRGWNRDDRTPDRRGTDEDERGYRYGH